MERWREALHKKMYVMVAWDHRNDPGPQIVALCKPFGIDPPLDGGVAEDRPCETNAGCAFTRVAPGACCPMLCTPRVVTRKRAGELAANVAACNRGQGCPQPLCRPISRSIEPKCEAGRCVGRTTAPPQD